MKPSPLIGGSFSKPSDRYPLLFNSRFWKEYPYFLPCLVAAAIAIIGVALGYAFLDEVTYSIFSVVVHYPADHLHHTDPSQQT